MAFAGHDRRVARARTQEEEEGESCVQNYDRDNGIQHVHPRDAETFQIVGHLNWISIDSFAIVVSRWIRRSCNNAKLRV